MVDSRRHRLDLCRLQPIDDLLRADTGRQVQIADRKTEQVVTHGSTDISGGTFVSVERPQQLRHAAALAPFCRVELQLHCSLRDRLTIMAAVAPQILRSFHMIS